MENVQDLLTRDCGLSNMGRCTDTFGPRKGIVRRTDEGKPICRRSARGRCVLTDVGKQMTRRERIAKRGVGGFTGTDVAINVIDGLTSIAQGETGRQGRRVRRGRSLPPSRRRRRRLPRRREPSTRGRKSSRDRSRSRRAPRRKRDRDKLFRGTTAVVAILGTLAALRMINNKKKDQSQLPPPRAQQRRRRSSKKKKRRRSRKRKK